MRITILSLFALLVLFSCESNTPKEETTETFEVVQEPIDKEKLRADSLEMARRDSLANLKALKKEQLTKEIAGTYIISVKGMSDQDAEKLELRSGGTASWRWGRTIKNGSWRISNDDEIMVSISGNSGLIHTWYRLKDGTYVDKSNSSRSLKKK